MVNFNVDAVMTMKLKVWKRYDLGVDIFILVMKGFEVRLFTDYGEWFLYITIGKKWWRFSSAGFMKGG